MLATQFNFALSTTLTWHDRRGAAPLWRRWLLFHGSIAAMAAVNGLVFLAARGVVAPLPASAAGIAAAALGNFVLSDRIVFHAAVRTSRRCVAAPRNPGYSGRVV